METRNIAKKNIQGQKKLNGLQKKGKKQMYKMSIEALKVPI